MNFKLKINFIFPNLSLNFFDSIKGCRTKWNAVLYDILYAVYYKPGFKKDVRGH